MTTSEACLIVGCLIQLLAQNGANMHTFRLGN